MFRALRILTFAFAAPGLAAAHASAPDPALLTCDRPECEAARRHVRSAWAAHYLNEGMSVCLGVRTIDKLRSTGRRDARARLADLLENQVRRFAGIAAREAWVDDYNRANGLTVDWLDPSAAVRRQGIDLCRIVTAVADQRADDANYFDPEEWARRFVVGGTRKFLVDTALLAYLAYGLTHHQADAYLLSAQMAAGIVEGGPAFVRDPIGSTHDAALALVNGEPEDAGSVAMGTVLTSVGVGAAARGAGALRRFATILRAQREMIAALEIENAAFRAAAYRHRLGGLLNRNAFTAPRTLKWIRELNAGNRSFAILRIDVDWFKMVNDTLGHGVGDELLEELSRAARIVSARYVREVRSTLRASDMAFRPGGDEFMIVLDGADEAGARTVAMRALDDFNKVADELQIGERIGRRWNDLPESYRQRAARGDLPDPSKVGRVSIGIAVRSPKLQTFEAVREAADLDMLAARTAGRPLSPAHDPSGLAALSSGTPPIIR